MRKPDDCSLDQQEFLRIRKYAKRALEAADGLGRFPTPVAAVMQAANVIVSEEDALDESFLQRICRKATNAGKAVKKAISKVLGLLDATARLIYIDRAVLVVKQTFLELHETGHAVLPWHREIYGAFEDCEKTLSPEVSEQFDREASVFASEVLFQLDSFTHEANGYEFGILVPIKLSKRFGASIYAAVRRYVSQNHRICTVLVINPPEFVEGAGFVASLRRVVSSQEFERVFGSLSWPEEFTPDDEIGAMIPVSGRRMSRARPCTLIDRNGRRHECLAEAFTQGYQVFVLIHAVATLTHKVFVASSGT